MCGVYVEPLSDGSARARGFEWRGNASSDV